MKERKKHLDILRFFAILSIVLIHIICLFKYKYFQSSKFEFALFTFIDCFTRAGVPLFFMLTGVLMFTKKEQEKEINYKQYLKKRVVKLVVPYVFFSIFYYIVTTIINESTFSLYNLIEGILSGNIVYHLWFMPVIIIIYIFLPFLKRMVLNLKKQELKTLIILIFILGNISIFGLIVSNYFGYNIINSFLLPNIIIYTNYLFLGYYVEKNKINIDKKLVIGSILSIIMMLMVTVFISKEVIIDTLMNSVSPFTILPSILIFTYVKNHIKTIKISKFIYEFMKTNSKNVFYIYLWHLLPVTIISFLSKKVLLKTNFIQDILLCIVFYFITLMSTFIIVILWERLKLFIKKNVEIIIAIFIQIFLAIFALVFSFVFINIILNRYNFIKINYLFYMVALFIIIALFMIVNKYKHIIYKYRFINIIMCIIYIVFQIIFICSFEVTPSWDFGSIYDIAVRYATGVNHLSNENYLYMCSNNIGFATMVAIVFKIFYMLGIKNFLVIGIAINCIFINLGMIYTYMTINQIEKKYSKVFISFAIFFTPIFCYLPIFYTDSLSIPFIAITIYYIYMYLFKKQKILYLVIIGFAFGIGYIIKPTILIVFVALLLSLLLSSKKLKKVNYFKMIFIITVFLLIPFLSYKIYLNKTFDKERMNDFKTPMNHYIMMGLSGNGAFNEKDADYTTTFKGVELKKEKDNKKIQERLKKHIEDKTLLSFYEKKISFTWTDGTLFANEKLSRMPKYEDNVKYVKSENDSSLLYWTISNVQWSLIVLLMIIGVVLRKYLIESTKQIQLILMISIFGLFLFLILWETRSRYIFNFTPIFLINSYIGLIALTNFIDKRKKEVNKNEKKNTFYDNV